MSGYTILIILIGILALLFLMGFFFFVQWIDKKIDRKERLGDHSKWENVKEESTVNSNDSKTPKK